MVQKSTGRCLPVETGEGAANGVYLPANMNDAARRMLTAVDRARRRAVARAVLATPYSSVKPKTQWQSVNAVLNFVFPPSIQRPHSTGRLFALAEYGPLSPTGELCGGKRHARPLTPHEIKALIAQMEQDDILAVYMPNEGRGLSSAERKAVLTDVASAKLTLPRLDASQVVQLLTDVDDDGDGRVSFHALATAIRAARAQRQADMRVMYPTLTQGVRAGAAIAARISILDKALGRNSLAARVGPPDAGAELLRRAAAQELAASLGPTAAAAALGQAATGSVRAGPVASIMSGTGVGRPHLSSTQAGAWLSRPAATVNVRTAGESGKPDKVLHVGALTLAKGTGREKAPQAWLDDARKGRGLTDAQISVATQRTLARSAFAVRDMDTRTGGSGASSASLRANALLMRPMDAPSDLTTFDTTPLRSGQSSLSGKWSRAL